MTLTSRPSMGRSRQGGAPKVSTVKPSTGLPIVPGVLILAVAIAVTYLFILSPTSVQVTSPKLRSSSAGSSLTNDVDQVMIQYCGHSESLTQATEDAEAFVRPFNNTVLRDVLKDSIEVLFVNPIPCASHRQFSHRFSHSLHANRALSLVNLMLTT